MLEQVLVTDKENKRWKVLSSTRTLGRVVDVGTGGHSPDPAGILTTPERSKSVDDERPEDKEYRELAEYSLAAHELIRDVLTQLPIPIHVAQIGEGWDGAIELFALDRVASDLIHDQPLTAFQKALVQRMIVDWLTVYELGALIKMAGPAPWRFAGVRAGITRIVSYGETIGEQLGFEVGLDPDDSE
jgi:hypothetical protein